ncbi:MAG: phenylacetate--CoA ligase family protein [Gemmataceae bacterium]
MAGPDTFTLDRNGIQQMQATKLQALLAEVVPANPFYAQKFAQAGLSGEQVKEPTDLSRLPFTTKAELQDDQARHPPYGTNLTFPLAGYSRLHQTSGSYGKPLRWLDTVQTWNWMLDCWTQYFRMIGLRPDDRLFFPFSFGPFLGFWTAFEAATRLGNFCLPAGGMSSTARLRFLLDNDATIVLATPTYAQHLVDVAKKEGIDLAGSSVRAVIVAGEPGGGIPSTRQRIEQGWGARLFDHCGMTEIGPAGIECLENPVGLHLLETDYLAEIIDPETAEPVASGRTGELVLTNLGRTGSPLLRYRTGDLVCRDLEPCPCGRPMLRLKGGILGRVDDMIHLRGNNVYPSALEAVIRRFPEVAEYRVEVNQSATLPSLRIELEPVNRVERSLLAERVDRAIRDEFLFRAEVREVAPGSLPRFEMKAQRIKRS